MKRHASSKSSTSSARPLRSGTVPAQYREVLYWRITQSTWKLTVVNLLSLVMFVVMGAVFVGWVVLLNRMPKALDLQLVPALVLILAMVVTLILHELAHALAMVAYGARPRFGVLWQGLMLYATSPGYAFRRNDYLVVILAPLVGLSLLALMVILFAPPNAALLLAICATVNGAGAVGDLWIMLITLRYPVRAYVMDERDGMRIFLPA
jgi:hypothetical protein